MSDDVKRAIITLLAFVVFVGSLCVGIWVLTEHDRQMKLDHYNYCVKTQLKAQDCVVKDKGD